MTDHNGLEVTPQEMKDGYWTETEHPVGTLRYPRTYEVIRQLPSGNYLVKEPKHDA